MADARRLGTRPRLSRRAALTGMVLGAGSALGLAACSGTASHGPDASRTPAISPTQRCRLFAQPDLDFEASFGLGEAAYGASEVGEVLAAVERINAAGASYAAFVDGFSELARGLAARADAALRAGRRVSARAASLRAAHYYKQALYFVLGTSRPADEAAVYGAMQAQWDRAARLFDPPFERVRIPYEGTTLPGYFLAPKPSRARRPTIILNNGSDGQNIDLWAYGGAAALERGYNALIFEGPGQGAMLFERQIPFRPDWEKVVTPIVDFLVARGDVDARRIGIIGWSMGGGLVARAAAFEPRLAAVCCDPGTADSWASFPEPLRAIAAAGGKDEVNRAWRTGILADLSPIEKFTLMKKLEIFGKRFQDQARAGQVTDDFYDLAQTVRRFRYIDVVSRITAPVLVTDYEQEHTTPPRDGAGSLRPAPLAQDAGEVHGRRGRRLARRPPRAAAPQRGDLRLVGGDAGPLRAVQSAGERRRGPPPQRQEERARPRQGPTGGHQEFRLDSIDGPSLDLRLKFAHVV